MEKGQKKMKYKQTKCEKIPYSTYVNILENDNQITLIINHPYKNMQENEANFEALALIYKCANPNAIITIQFKEQEWDGQFIKYTNNKQNDNLINAYLRFLYRIVIFKQAFPDWVILAKENQKEVLRFENLFLEALANNAVTNNIPNSEPSFNVNKRRRTRN